MSAIREDQLKAEQEFQRRLWEFRKKYYNPEKEDGYWRAVVDESKELFEALKGNGLDHEYMRRMIIDCVSDFDERSRRRATCGA